jgi:tetratricopeptide (TPR) repeat protein
LQARLERSWEVGDFRDAAAAARQILQLREKEQGAQHWQIVEARWLLVAMERAGAAPAEDRAAFREVPRLRRQAEELTVKRQYLQARSLSGKALEVCRRVLGEGHPETASGHQDVATGLLALGQFGEAESDYRKALKIRIEAFGSRHPLTAASHDSLATLLQHLGRYAEAEEGYRRALAIQREVLGEEHPDTATTSQNLARSQQFQGRYAEAEEGFRKTLALLRRRFGEEHRDTATCYHNLAVLLQRRWKHAEAEQGFRKALAIRRKLLGEEDVDTATSYGGLASNHIAQGKYAEAEEGYRKVLDVFRKVFGEEHPVPARYQAGLSLAHQLQGKYAEAEEEAKKALQIRLAALGELHPETAESRTGLALLQQTQGKYPEAEEGFRKALAVSRQRFGELHPDTATIYNCLAQVLDQQGNHAEAERMHRQALTIHRRVFGEIQPETATSLHNLAVTLQAQRKYAEAEAGFRRAAAIFREVIGERDVRTATAVHNVAMSLKQQGKHAEAEAGLRKALAIRLEVWKENHPDTALSYSDLAGVRLTQGRYAEAEEGFGKALAITRRLVGELHPWTAAGYQNLALAQQGQGKYVEAEQGFRKALAIRLETLGDHPDTETVYYNLARNQQGQGKYAEAEEQAKMAARIFARTRLRVATSGLDRAGFVGERNNLRLLPVLLARNGKPDQAWEHFEESLGRGIGDDFAVRLRLTPAERQRRNELLTRVRQSEARLQRAGPVSGSEEARQEQRRRLLDDLRRTQDALAKLNAELDQKYGPLTGQTLGVAELQKALPPDGAFLGWLDIGGSPKAKHPDGEHWVVLLKARGGPLWFRVKGSGTGGGWTREDSELPSRLWEALASPRSDWRRLADRLRRQRLGPLAEQLEGVRSLVVLPSVALDGLPLEVLADGRTVSYAPSASLFVHLTRQPRPKSDRVLVLADPTLERPASSPLPPGGVLVRMVNAGGGAYQARLQPGDVLLKYGGQEVTDSDQLGRLIAASGGQGKVELTVWRDGRTAVRTVGAGGLGVVLDRLPARQALERQHQVDRLLTKARGEEDCPPLPGTRVEAEALSRLVGPKRVTVLADSDASEQKLDELARAGRLQEFRYLHLATHGLADTRTHLQSALILARDALPDPDRQLEAGRPVYEGRLTAEEVLQGWELDSELVTLSACRSGLGKHESGEGHLGFAQAFLLAGSRSVLVSLWKVDDFATALLMDRFYQNLLGRREGLTGPLSKAEALAEAKVWLRRLSRAEASRRGAELLDGVERGKGKPKLPLPPELPKAPAGVQEEDARPYAHPYYWAAFVLVGRPD